MTRSKCSFKYLSSILYCASQNRDNRQCCADLDLNASQLMVEQNYINTTLMNILQVGSRCLRFCDPSGVSVGKITKEDVVSQILLHVI